MALVPVTDVRVDFDRSRPSRAILDASRRVLSRIGRAVGDAARRSIRSRRGPSPVGEPPHSHTGALRRRITPAWDPATRSVVIGPTPTAAGSRVPQVLEFGGVVVRRVRGRIQRARYGPRPYMGPALRRTLPLMAPMWRDSVR